MTIENAISAIALLGIGGVLGRYYQILWERMKEVELHKQEFKEARYKCVILLMHAAFDFQTHAPALAEHGRRFSSLDYLVEELKTEWNNMILFASEEALMAVHEFIRSPSVESFKRSAIAMRSDLWGGKVSERVFKLEFSEISSE